MSGIEAAASSKADRISEIETELNRSDGLLEQLCEAVNFLQNRISPVLNGEIDEALTEDRPEPVLCDLANTLRGKNQRLNLSILNIRSISDRVEL